MMSLGANLGLYPYGVSWTSNLLTNCHSNFSKHFCHFHRQFAASKTNCGRYLDAAVSALRTLDRKIFRSKCNFFNEQAESTYLRQFAKKANIFFDSKMSLRRNSGRPNERTRVSVWCQIARTFDKNQKILRCCLKKSRLRFISAFRKHWVQNLVARLSTVRRFFD